MVSICFVGVRLARSNLPWPAPCGEATSLHATNAFGMQTTGQLIHIFNNQLMAVISPLVVKFFDRGCRSVHPVMEGHKLAVAEGGLAAGFA
jgi:hypothetical protein